MSATRRSRRSIAPPARFDEAEYMMPFRRAPAPDPATSPARGRAKSKSPARGRAKSKSPARSRAKSKSPARGRAKSKSPARKAKTPSKSPARGRAKSKSPARTAKTPSKSPARGRAKSKSPARTAKTPSKSPARSAKPKSPAAKSPEKSSAASAEDNEGPPPSHELSDGGFGEFSADVISSLISLSFVLASVAYAAFVAVIFVLWLNSEGYSTVLNLKMDLQTNVDTTHILDHNWHWIETGFLNLSLPLIRPFADTINGANSACADQSVLDSLMGNLLMLVLITAVVAIFDRPDVAAISPRVSRGYQLLTLATAVHLTMVQWCPDERPVAGIVIADNHMVVVNVIFMFAIALAVVSLVHRSFFRNIGVPQAFGASTDPTMCTDGVYGFVRYPFQFAVILALWAGPPTYGRWFFAVGMTCAVYFQTVLRDEDLARLYGTKFTAYASQVPRFGSSLLSNPFAE